MRRFLARLGAWLPPQYQPAFTEFPATPTNGTNAMPKAIDSVARLRREHHSLADLPDRIGAPWRGADEVVPLEVATVDDIAFAVVAANARVSAAIGHLSALESLHRHARETGAIGTDLAVDAALRKEAR